MALLELTDECRTAIEGWDGRFGSPSPQNRGKRALRVFKNGFVERVFATSHPILPGLWFGPIIVYGLYA
ncbi:MAG: hypothetical protein IT379_07195, partial [Deltaproteobacteria bacterium]|nr:hypothetical protein [Deltaproteobacteria bacterium]